MCEYTESTPNLCFVCYGAQGSGKTYYIKRWLEENKLKYAIYTPETNYTDWKGKEKYIVKDGDFSRISKFRNIAIVLDDMEGLTRHEQEVTDLFLQSRHRGTPGVIVSHSPRGINNQIRMNIARVVIMSINTAEMFKHVKQIYSIEEPIELFKLEYGYIEYDIRKRNVKYFDKNDKDVTEIFVNNIEKVKEKAENQAKKKTIINPRMIELIKYKDTLCLTHNQEKTVKELLEREYERMGASIKFTRTCYDKSLFNFIL